MQNIVIDKPYVPVLPHRGRCWQEILKRYLPQALRTDYGVVKVEARHVERLRESRRRGHGIILAPNHCRDEDPMVVGMLARLCPTPLYLMASWHLFMQNPVKSFLLPRAGAFSVYREGIDRGAISLAAELIAEAERPLVLFPEGQVSRSNDALNELQDGVALIGRIAAKRRAKQTPPGKVVVHPVAVRYRFLGDASAAIARVLREIEQRMGWVRRQDLPLEQRIYRVGEGLLARKELDILRAPQAGSIAQRLRALIEAILGPLEKEWVGGNGEGSVNARVKRLRAAILPDMVRDAVDAAERKRRWKQLADLYLANQLAHYPPDYVRSNPSPARMLETVERFEEDLTDRVRVRGNIAATLTIGKAIEVGPEREGRGGDDPLLSQIEAALQGMLGIDSRARAS